MNIKWVNQPPVEDMKAGRTQRFVAELRKRPLAWALYPATLKSPAGLSSYRANFPDIEWTGRTRPDGRCDVYARCVLTPPSLISVDTTEFARTS